MLEISDMKSFDPFGISTADRLQGWPGQNRVTGLEPGDWVRTR